MNNSVTTKKNQQTLKLIEGTFTKREALNIINSVVDVKINFHKVHRLSIQEGNENDECKFDNSRIQELMESKKETKAFLRALESKGQNIKITSTVTISLEE
jgi:Na+/H+ antiporter NhaB